MAQGMGTRRFGDPSPPRRSANRLLENGFVQMVSAALGIFMRAATRTVARFTAKADDLFSGEIHTQGDAGEFIA